MPGKLLEVNIEASRRELGAIGSPQLLYLLVDIKPASSANLVRAPFNLSLVIDRSTSMRGRRLENVLAAATMIVEKLSPDDFFSVVTFSDRASVVVGSSSQQDKAIILNQLRKIEASGGTEVFRGLEAGYRELSRVPLKDHTNHLILLTDGHTYGDSDACLEIVREGASDGISLSAFGIGTDWNGHFLDQLAALSGGETSYIATPGMVVQALQQCIQGLGSVYARNIRLSTEFPSAFKLIAAFRVAPSAQPLGINGNDLLHLGNVEGGARLSFLMELKAASQEPGTKLGLDFELMADIPSESARNHRVRVHYDFDFVAGQPEGEPPKAVVAAVQAWNFHQMNDKVWNDIENGNLKQAQTRMHLLTQRLTEAGHTKLAHQVHAENERLSAGTGVSAESQKALTFATRSLVNQTVRLRTIEDEPL